MKKILTIILGSFLGVAVSASELQPQVTLRTTSNYDVKIDNNFYNGNTTTIPNLGQGNHRVEVYQVKAGSGIFGIGKKRVLVSTSQFTLRNNDVVIDVNQYGETRIYDSGYNGTNNNQGRDNNGNRDRNVNRRGNGNDGDYDDNNHNNNGNGHGNKNGHYKKNKQGKNKGNKHQEDDDENDNGRRENDN